MPQQSLYERLKHLRPEQQQQDLEEQEAYWEEDEDLQASSLWAAAGAREQGSCAGRCRLPQKGCECIRELAS